MKAPRGGLRPLHNRTGNVAKVELRVPPAGTVHAQDDVAAQLLASGDFAEGAAPSGLLDAVDTAHVARFPDDAPPKVEAPAKPAAKVAKK